MRNDTRLLFNAYVSQIATLSGVAVSSAGNISHFTVEPSVQQRLETRMQESSDFLTRINVLGVDDMEGAKVGINITSTTAGRTNTDNADRPTRDVSSLDEFGYQCKQTNFDTHLKYALIDAWAKFPDFQARIRDALLRRQALDRIMIGWNGTSAAAQTDRVANPLLQDVNIGWLKKLELEKPAALMLDTPGGNANQVTVGATGVYKTLDALVYDIKHELLPTWVREDTELVAIVGSDLMHDKYFPLVNQAIDPSEQLARDVILSTKRLGGLQAVSVPYFPANAVVVTRFDNLSIYYQNGKRRRSVIDNPKRDRIENFESSNEAYVIEDLDYICGAKNITLV